MAMIKCPECGGDVSDKAVTCPHCGYTVRAGDPSIKTNGTPVREMEVSSLGQTVLSLFMMGLGAYIEYKLWTSGNFMSYLVAWGALIFTVVGLVNALLSIVKMERPVDLRRHSPQRLIWSISFGVIMYVAYKIWLFVK